jgi:hypothetical protein
MIVTFGKERYEITDPRAEWTLNQDALPFCKSCRQQLKFQFVNQDYWVPAGIKCDHYSSHLTPTKASTN